MYSLATLRTQLSKFRDRPTDIVLKLCLKKLYQGGARCKRRVQIGLRDKLPAVHLITAAIPTRRNVFKGDSYRDVFHSLDCDSESKKRVLALIKSHYPESLASVVQDADEICSHTFDLLGSGKVSLDGKIDWHRDFKSGYRWPVKFHADIEQVNLTNNADVKIPRELSRFTHFTTLANAYLYSKDEKYALEFVSQLTDWIEENPPWMGVNWCCAMDVAIRLVNWIWAYPFFTDSPHFNDKVKTVFLQNLCSHAQYVAENLEYYGEFSDNHYATNVAALAIAGILASQFKQAERWKRVGLQGFFHEVISQVHPDGVHFEGSISYHRLVLEMFAFVVILCLQHGIHVPYRVWSRLEKMFEFVLYYTKPDGTAPQIGDTDNGRLLELGQSPLMDHRYLLAIGTALYKRSDFKAVAGAFHEEALWLLGEDGLKTFESVTDKINTLRSNAFRDGGFYFLRSEQLYMAVRCAGNGRRGTGNHSHNDVLSFELYAYDKSFIIDPGSYVYTAEPTSRNLFRSTAYHNTVSVDGEEINRIIPDRLFELMNDTAPVVNQWKTTQEADFLDAEHNGYQRLADPVTHRRQFYFGKRENYWVIRDLITGQSRHELSWYFHFDVGIDLQIKNAVTVETTCEQGANLILYALSPLSIRAELEEGWVSPSYGIKKKAQIAKYSCVTQLPTSMVFILYPYVGKPGSFSIPDAITARAASCWSAAA